MKRILHIACHHTNIGDGALIAGIQRSLQSIEPDLEFVNEDLMASRSFWGQTDYDADFFARAEREYDLIIVGGGGLIDSTRASRRWRGWTCSTRTWCWSTCGCRA